MSQLISANELQRRLQEAAAQYHVPGAALAVVQGDQVVTAVTGLANARTQQPVVTDTLFASGSVGKVFTASLIMSLVDEGLVDLDAPVQNYLPEFGLVNKEYSTLVTVRSLLDHTNGLPANFTPDVPSGPDMFRDFVACLSPLDFVAKPGRWWSYCNAGMVVAGRVAEAVTGTSYGRALATRILDPLGANATTDAEEMMIRSVAVGHIVDPATGSMKVGPQFRMSLLHGPAGTSLWIDIHGMVAFAKMHLNGGRGANGEVLSEASVKTMATPQVDLPWASPMEHFGLGWGIRDAPDGPVIGHTGANIGMHSVLWVIPDKNAAITLLTNGTTGVVLQSTLVASLMEELFNVPRPVTLTAPEQPVDVPLNRLVGTYAADQGRAKVNLVDGRLQLTMEYDAYLLKQFDQMGIPQSPAPLPMIAVDSDRFLAEAAPGMYMAVVFHSGADKAAPPTHVHVGRLFKRE